MSKTDEWKISMAILIVMTTIFMVDYYRRQEIDYLAARISVIERNYVIKRELVK